jgi:Na+/proline symporter
VKEVRSYPREILPYTARFALPSLVGALLLGAVFAKIISTANNYLFSPATNLVNDVYVRYVHPDAGNTRVLLVSRLAVVGLGVWAIVQAAQLTSVLAMVFYAYTIYSAAITPVVMAAFFWKRATAKGAVVSILLGTVVTVFWNSKGLMHWAVDRLGMPVSWAERDAIFPALILSLAGLIVVSLLTSPPRKEQVDPFFAD